MKDVVQKSRALALVVMMVAGTVSAAEKFLWTELLAFDNMQADYGVAERLYASNANLSFDKTAMTADLLAAIFRVMAEKRIHLLQPNCTSVEELLDAQRHPERHQDLIVKVCGFSARFIALSPKFQDEIIARHRLR